MLKQLTINFLLKRKTIPGNASDEANGQNSVPESSRSKSPILESVVDQIERDPGKRKQIWEYPEKERDEIRRAYLRLGPYQPRLTEYNKFGPPSHPHRFQSSWFNLYPSWLEYSPEVDAAFCLPCFLFDNPNGHSGLKAFTVNGFRNWKKVRNGKLCGLLNHVGMHPNSPHQRSQQACEDLLNQHQHIPQMLTRQSARQIQENRLRLKASIDAVLYLALQGCAFGGHDESLESTNRGNCLELLKVFGSYNEKVASVILDKAPRNASYTSPDTQKEILQVISEKVKWAIRDEVGTEKFCIIVDEASDISRKEQMAIILRFVDRMGFIRERFFSIVHVPNTSSVTLKNAIVFVLTSYNFNIQDIRGQGYDGASNMRGEWNGLQALICADCPYAYYIHCFAHRLQLALVAASREVIPVHQFFFKLSSIITFVLGSCKRSDELKSIYAAEIASLIEIGVLETGSGLNQLGNLQRPGDTRWGSHLKSISSLLKMFNANLVTLSKLVEEGTTPTQRGEAVSSLEALTSFDFIFILHLMKDIMEITDKLCQALQRKSQDILNAVELVSNTENLIQDYRDNGWSIHITKVKSFCEAHNIEVPDMSTNYVARRGRARLQRDIITVEHHYHFDIFNAAIDFQLQELKSRFSSRSVELLALSCALDPKEASKNFRGDEISRLVNQYYPEDFTQAEKEELRVELLHYENEMSRSESFQSLSGISELCRWLFESRKCDVYPLIYRLIKLVLTLPVSTATTERAFSAMNIVKTMHRNKMDDDYLERCLNIYIEKEIAKKFSIDSIIDGFRNMRERRALL